MRPVTERLSPLIRTLVLVNALVFFFYALVREAHGFFEQHLALGPSALRGAEPWQLGTSLFVHIEPLSFFFAIVGLWFVGASGERAVGTRRVLKVFFGAGLAANLAMALLAMALGTSELFAGCNTAVLALFVVFGIHYNRTPARVFGALTLEARTLTAILIGFSLLADVTRGSWTALGGDVVAVLAGYVLGGGPRLRDLLSGWGGGGTRHRYQVIQGGRGRPSGPTYLN
jgi:membrane associated rhomboid family serine protease